MEAWQFLFCTYSSGISPRFFQPCSHRERHHGFSLSPQVPHHMQASHKGSERHRSSRKWGILQAGRFFHVFSQARHPGHARLPYTVRAGKMQTQRTSGEIRRPCFQASVAMHLHILDHGYKQRSPHLDLAQFLVHNAETLPKDHPWHTGFPNTSRTMRLDCNQQLLQSFACISPLKPIIST